MLQLEVPLICLAIKWFNVRLLWRKKVLHLEIGYWLNLAFDEYILDIEYVLDINFKKSNEKKRD